MIGQTEVVLRICDMLASAGAKVDGVELSSDEVFKYRHTKTVLNLLGDWSDIDTFVTDVENEYGVLFIDREVRSYKNVWQFMLAVHQKVLL